MISNHAETHQLYQELGKLNILMLCPQAEDVYVLIEDIIGNRKRKLVVDSGATALAT